MIKLEKVYKQKLSYTALFRILYINFTIQQELLLIIRCHVTSFILGSSETEYLHVM